ncbi:hypothetical protein M9Y10_030423 [Tritrichomonas musculus]|uniref:2'-5' RNA ligase n=1 Tax=Tritrichomonas musculus TaxID=1915356 RepID=A0ABR2H478_9EUKA
MNIYNEDKLKQNYAKIFDQNKEALLNGGHGDPYLNSSKVDTRMGLSLLIRIKSNVSEKISNYIHDIQSIEPNLYYYPPSDFHITVLDILRGEPDRTVPENLNDYISCIKECANKVKPFILEFRNITASDNCVLICGYYEEGLEKLRQLIRKSLAERNLPLEERYQTFSSHLTVVRIPEQLKEPQKFIEQIKREIYFGQMEVDSLELSFHNWYDSKKTKLADIVLKKV